MVRLTVRKLKLIVWIIILFFLFKSVYNWVKLNKNSLPTPSLKPTLSGTVAKSLLGTKGTYAMVIKNFKTGESYDQLADRVFEAGSLYKLWLMATTFDQIKKGVLQEDLVLSQDISYLNNYFEIPKEEAELTDGAITLSASDAVTQMITISHNYAAMLLAEKLGKTVVRNFLAENGFKNSFFGNPSTTTALDTTLFFDKLYKGELVDKETSAKMIEILKKQQLIEGLPKYLPNQDMVANKTGDIGDFKHDAGLVFTDKGDYLIVVLSKSDSPYGAQERIAQLSKDVFDYFYSK